MYVIYWRVEPNVVDMRKFKNLEELADWLFGALKFEPIALVGIYNGDTTIEEVKKDYDKYVNYFERPEDKRGDFYQFRKGMNE